MHGLGLGRQPLPTAQAVALVAAAMAASTSTPGGLSSEETPMFVLFTVRLTAGGKTGGVLRSS